MSVPFNTNSNNTPLASPLLFRGSDHLRLAGLIKSVTVDGMSLSMVSDQICILDHYAEIFTERIQQIAPEIVHEVYFPTSSESLINRFNEILSRQSMEDAMESEALINPPRLWVIHDAGALPNHEIELLARLVQNFPGSNIRVLFLITTQSKKQKMLDSFGKKIISWEIKPPTPAQAAALMEQAGTQGQQNSIWQLLKKIEVYEPPSWPPQPKPVVKKAPEPPPIDTLTADPASAPEAFETNHKKSRLLPWLLGGFMLLGVCFGSVFFFMKDNSFSKGIKIKPTSTITKSETPKPIAPDTTKPITDKDALETKLTSDKNSEAIAPPQNFATTELSKLQTENPQVNEILKILGPSANANGYIIVHSVEPKQQSALKWQADHPSVRNTVIYTSDGTKSESVKTFVVLSGTFDSEVTAQKFVAESSPKSGAVVVSLREFLERMEKPALTEAPVQILSKRKVTSKPKANP